MFNSKNELKKINDEIARRKNDLSLLNNRVKELNGQIGSLEEYLKIMEGHKKTKEVDIAALDGRLQLRRDDIKALTSKIDELKDDFARMVIEYDNQKDGIAQEKIYILEAKAEAEQLLGETKKDKREVEALKEEAKRILEINNAEAIKQSADRALIVEAAEVLKKEQERHETRVKNFSEDIHSLKMAERQVEADKKIISEQILELKQKEQAIGKLLDRHTAAIDEMEAKKIEMEAAIAETQKRQESLNRGIAALELERKKMMNEKLQIIKLLDEKKTDEAMNELVLSLKGKI